MQLSFIDEPDVNFNVTMSHGAEPLTNAFEPWLMSFIEDYITNNYTYPGHIFSPIKEVGPGGRVGLVWGLGLGDLGLVWRCLEAARRPGGGSCWGFGLGGCGLDLGWS